LRREELSMPTFKGILGCRIKLLFEEKVGLKFVEES
jgi:hypothetical protein